MDLTQYISDSGARTRLAADLSCNRNYLWQIATGRRRPSESLAASIEVHTGGAVTCEDLLPDLDWERDNAGAVTGYRVRLAPTTSTTAAMAA